MRIYFDNAATTPLLPQVWEKMSEVLKNDFGNPSSIHHYGRVSRSIIEDARKKVARTIGSSIGEIFFTSSATEANNTILHRSAIDLGISRFISSPTEHHCVLHTLQHLQKENPKIEVIWLQVDNHGCINPAELESHLAEESKKTMVSLMYGNNEIGTIHDIATIGSICKKHNAYLHCDAVQMIGKYEVDVQALGVSFLSGTAHKFHGPKGSGFFYMKSDNIIQPYIYGGAQERNMRAGTENVAGIAGLAEALTLAMGEMTHRRSHISGLKHRFEEQLLNEVEGILFNHPTGDQCMYHLSSVSFPESSMAEMLMFNLDIEGIAASSGSACSAGIAEDSHVLQAIGHPQGRKTVRFSFSSLNTEEEVDATVAKIKKLMTPR
ncbi:MAG: cysteine desulfurase [Saprospiraceae bacterium]|nr:cysteine desulfurase [Saprospiraceae bacterium]